MDIPSNLYAWTLDTIVAIVEQHEFEPGRFDYKTVLNATLAEGRDDHLTSIRRATVSMANGSGGYILFGVRDRNMKVATARDRIVGIPIGSDLRKEFGDKLHTVERDIFFDAWTIPLPTDASKCIFVVQIPTSLLRPHAFAGTFYIRSEGGSATPMSFFEVRDQMLYTEGRLQKVTLLRLELASFIDVLNLLDNPPTWNVRLEPAAFKVLLADISDMLPPTSGLLAVLHDIGSRATILNHILDKADVLRFTTPAPGIEAQTKSEVLQRAITNKAELFNLCGKAQSRLEEVFGPLKLS